MQQHNIIKRLRSRTGLSQFGLSREMGVSEFSVWRWENNQRPITTSHLKLLVSIAIEIAKKHYPHLAGELDAIWRTCMTAHGTNSPEERRAIVERAANQLLDLTLPRVH